MVSRPKRESDKPTNVRRPATTPRGRENQLVSLAYDLVEQRLRDGTASATETTQLLKFGTERERLERQRIKYENDLLVVKKETMESQKRTEELFQEAMDYFRAYSGNGPPPTESDQDA